MEKLINKEPEIYSGFMIWNVLTADINIMQTATISGWENALIVRAENPDKQYRLRYRADMIIAEIDPSIERCIKDRVINYITIIELKYGCSASLSLSEWIKQAA